jgi:hypothetical protein
MAQGRAAGLPFCQDMLDGLRHAPAGEGRWAMDKDLADQVAEIAARPVA